MSVKSDTYNRERRFWAVLLTHSLWSLQQTCNKYVKNNPGVAALTVSAFVFVLNRVRF
jgi:hypothetical protein